MIPENLETKKKMESRFFFRKFRIHKIQKSKKNRIQKVYKSKKNRIKKNQKIKKRIQNI